MRIDLNISGQVLHFCIEQEVYHSEKQNERRQEGAFTPCCECALWYTLEKRSREWNIVSGKEGFSLNMFIQATLLPIPTPEVLRRVRQLVEETGVLTNYYSNLKSATATRM